jgi:hypothetical protein
MSKKKNLSVTQEIALIDESSLFERVTVIIENRKSRAAAFANSEVTLMYWEVGRLINSVILDSKRAEYGKRIVATLATQLAGKYGKSFELRNLHRMMQFAEEFPNFEIVSPLATQLSWSHFIELLPLESNEARLYYARDAAARRLGKRELRHQISRKTLRAARNCQCRIIGAIRDSVQRVQRPVST